MHKSFNVNYSPHLVMRKLEMLPLSFSGPVRKEKLLYNFESKLLRLSLNFDGALAEDNFTYKMKAETEVGVGFLKTKPYAFLSKTTWSHSDDKWRPLYYQESLSTKRETKGFEVNDFESGLDPLSLLLYLRLADLNKDLEKPMSVLRRNKRQEIYLYQTESKKEKLEIFSEMRESLRIDWGSIDQKTNLKKNKWCVWLDKETQVLIKAELDIPAFGPVSLSLKKVELG